MTDISLVLIGTIIQSALSAGLGLLLAVIGALGLIRLKQGPLRIAAEILVSFVGLVPPLFVIVAAMNVFDFVNVHFPFGITGVVLVHALYFSGIVAVGLARTIEDRFGEMAALAMVEGASSLQFWRSTVGAFRPDLATAGLFLFIAAFSSFAVPLIVGGQAGGTLEIAVFRIAFGEGNFSGALWVAGLQMVFLFFVSATIANGTPSRMVAAPWARYFGSWSGLVVLLGITFGILAGSLFGVVEGFRELVNVGSAAFDLPNVILGTVGQGLVAAGGTYLLVGVLCYFWPNRFLQIFTRGFAAPSTVLTGILFFLLLPEKLRFGLWPIPWAGMGFALLTFPSVYRLRLEGALSQLEGQITTAKVIGASRRQIFSQVVWPQTKPEAIWLAGLVSLWVAGDFGFTFIVLEKPATLGTLAQSLLGGYRLEIATAIMWLAFLLGGVLFLTLSWMSHVSRRKLNS